MNPFWLGHVGTFLISRKKKKKKKHKLSFPIKSSTLPQRNLNVKLGDREKYKIWNRPLEYSYVQRQLWWLMTAKDPVHVQSGEQISVFFFSVLSPGFGLKKKKKNVPIFMT